MAGAESGRGEVKSRWSWIQLRLGQGPGAGAGCLTTPSPPRAPAVLEALQPCTEVDKRQLVTTETEGPKGTWAGELVGRRASQLSLGVQFPEGGDTKREGSRVGDIPRRETGIYKPRRPVVQTEGGGAHAGACGSLTHCTPTWGPE